MLENRAKGAWESSVAGSYVRPGFFVRTVQMRHRRLYYATDTASRSSSLRPTRPTSSWPVAGRPGGSRHSDTLITVITAYDVPPLDDRRSKPLIEVHVYVYSYTCTYEEETNPYYRRGRDSQSKTACSDEESFIVTARRGFAEIDGHWPGRNVFGAMGRQVPARRRGRGTTALTTWHPSTSRTTRDEAPGRHGRIARHRASA